MAYKISGGKNDTARVFVINEEDWTLEHNSVIAGTGDYEVETTSGKKLVFGRNTDGRVSGYGNVEASYYVSNFVFTVVPTSPFELPLVSDGTYDFVVDWGDDSNDTITTWSGTEKLHNYAGSGPYTVTISGTITGWSFNDNSYAPAMRDISNWGLLRLGNNGDYFKGCENMTVSATDILDTTGTTDMSYAFYGCLVLSDIPNMGDWDMSAVTDMNHMFADDTRYYLEDPGVEFNGDISGWDTSSVTDMSYMFYSNDAFNQDISGWDVSKVTTMSRMFQAATSFNTTIAGWDTSSVTNMRYMFFWAIDFDQDLSSLDVTSVTDAYRMLHGSDLSTANYDALLIGWAAQDIHTGIAFGCYPTKYTGGGAAETAHTYIDVTKSWAVHDGGQV